MRSPDSRSHTIAALSSPHVTANLPLVSQHTLLSRPVGCVGWGGAAHERTHQAVAGGWVMV